METIWLYDDRTSDYHDQRCKCPSHCGNCFRMIEEGRKRYCSDYCKNRMARERALDRRLASYRTAP